MPMRIFACSWIVEGRKAIAHRGYPEKGNDPKNREGKPHYPFVAKKINNQSGRDRNQGASRLGEDNDQDHAAKTKEQEAASSANLIFKEHLDDHQRGKYGPEMKIAVDIIMNPKQGGREIPQNKIKINQSAK